MKPTSLLALFVILLMVACTPLPRASPATAQEPAVQAPTQSAPAPVPADAKPAAYDPIIDPAKFTTRITNPYFSLPEGKRLVFRGETEDGVERGEVYVTGERKTVMGVETVVVWDRVWLNDELIEDTRDWFAQDDEGNVWYFGEDSAEMLDGKVVNHAGSWEAGVDGAKPGIVMLGNPTIGASYRQEYYAGEAEDRGDVLSLSEKVSVPYGTFTDCLKTKDYTPLEPDAIEYKYYCKEVGYATMELEAEDKETVELVSLELGAKPSPSEPVAAEPLQTEITEEKAAEIALAEVPGEVTDIAVERKLGKLVYVVEIDPDEGVETDVLIDIDTGEVLGIEN